MTKEYYYFLAFLALTSIFTCRSSRSSVNEKYGPPVRWMSYMKSPCFGHCAVYKMLLYRNGLCILIGKEYLERKGVYFTMLSTESLKKLQDLAKLDWPTYKDRYHLNMPDLPSSEFIIHDEFGAIVKKIYSNANLPKELSRLHAAISDLIDSEKWTLLQRSEDMTNPEILYSEIQIDLDSTLTVEKLQAEYPQYKIAKINRISEYMNYWLVSYDHTNINPYEILAVLRQKKGVRYANFNRQLLPRE